MAEDEETPADDARQEPCLLSDRKTDEASDKAPETCSQPQPWVLRMWGRSAGTLTIYLKKKPTFPPLSWYDNIFHLHPTQQQMNSSGWQNDRHSRGAAAYLREQNTLQQDAQTSEGAEVQVLRHLQWTREGAPAVDVGVGLRLGVDPVQLSPVARVRFCDSITIKAFPGPILKISKCLPFQFKGLRGKLRYEVPLDVNNLNSLWKPPARLLFRLEPAKNSDVQIYPGGVELGDNSVALGPNTELRVAAGLRFPRQFPYDASIEEPTLELHRLGIKTKW